MQGEGGESTRYRIGGRGDIEEKGVKGCKKRKGKVEWRTKMKK